MNASRLRWVAIVVPVVLIDVLDLVTDHEWSDLITAPVNTLAVPVIALVTAVVFARFAFGRIDRLTDDLRRQNATLARRNAALETLEGLSSGVATAHPIDEIFARVLESARTLLAADAAHIATGDDTEARVVASSGSAASSAATRSAPLYRDEAVIGSLTARWNAGDAGVPAETAELLASLANEAAVAVERDRLRRELRELAIRGERERIAREMHDGLAQVLGYVNTKAQAVEELLAADRPADARRQLAELSAAARSVYVDVREAILGLRSPVETERGLVGAMEEYANRFAEASKIAAAVTATASARAIDLAPEAQAEVFRIVREALTNVRKHASARRVTIAVATEEGALVVAVRDDGVGMPLAAADGWPRYGLRMMRERAAAIGAETAWSPAPGSGTVFTLRLPLERRASVPV